jgi:transcriptional regulator with XRE-family HTH domain
MQSDLQGFCVAVGDRVRRLRLERSLTQEDMSDYGFVVRHYQRIEAGRSVTLRTIWKLAQAFEVSPRELFPDGPKPRPRAKKAKVISPSKGVPAAAARAKHRPRLGR